MKQDKKKFKVLARHKWIPDVTITESCSKDDDRIRRFTATILGFRNWVLYEGMIHNNVRTVETLIKKATEIKNRILNKDYTVFHESVTISKQTIGGAQ